MNELLVNGSVLHTCNGAAVTIRRLLGEGGQGWVYEVDYNGEAKALKWYKPTGLGQNPQAFYENIQQNVLKGAPSKEFLWPQDITGWQDGSFGYIMDLRPAGYYELTQFLLCKIKFPSFKTVVDAALKIVSAFRILHNQGYSYQDLNDGNFFINPNNGDVLICDNDNVAPEGMQTGILGKPRYVAPEIVLGKGKPNSLSDRFSMSLILYMLLCMNHPLEGRRYLIPAMTEEVKQKLYGSEPLFMMDSDDDRNGPHPQVHRNSIMMWKCLPDYMRKVFLTAFSQKALQNPAARPKEIEWLNALTRFRSNIVPCSCGNEVFVPNGNSCKCDSCGRTLSISYRLELRDYAVPAVKDARIYRCQLGVCDAKDALQPVAHILEKKDSPGVFGIRNKTQHHWDAVTSKGTSRKVAPDEVVPVKPGISFMIENEKITIMDNK